jgi:hypothetical protein
MDSSLELKLEGKFVVRLYETTGKNPDGTKREDLLEGCREGQPVYIRRELLPAAGNHSVHVFDGLGRQLGTFCSEREIAVHLDRGGKAEARITNLPGRPGLVRRIFGWKKRTMDYHLEVSLKELVIPNDDPIFEKDREIVRTIARAEAHEKDSMRLAIRNYQQAIGQILELDSMGLRARAWRQSRIPVNRLSLALEKEGRNEEAIDIIDWYLGYEDYHGIDPYEREMILKRRERLEVDGPAKTGSPPRRMRGFD